MDDMRTNRIKTGALLFVATVAAGVSFFHIVTLALRYRAPEYAAAVLPISIDGLILVCSMELHQAAKNGRGHTLASIGLWAGVVVTFGANLGYGITANLGHGWTDIIGGAITSGMPALAFVISAEVTIMAARRTVRRRAAAPAVTVPAPAKNATGRKRGAEPPEFATAVDAYRASLTAGNPLSERKLADTHLGGNRHAAKRAVLAASNGHLA